MQNMVLIGGKRCWEGGVNGYEGMREQLFRYGLQHCYTMLKGCLQVEYMFLLL